jgi:hypothetical protein
MFGLLTKSVPQCQAKIRFENIEGDFPLTWRLNKPEPDQMSFTGDYPLDPSVRELYLRTAGENYTEKLRYHGIENVDFLPLMKKECYFLVTLEGSELAHLVLGKSAIIFINPNNLENVWAKEFNGVYLILKIPSEHNFWLKFDGNGYSEERGRAYRLKIKSRNEVEISRRYFR